jgi:hypothetical protein
MPHKSDTTLTGAAGEHLVLSRLLQRGVVAAQAPEGARKVDVLVSHLDGSGSYFIQVKSRQFGTDGGWHMSDKHEDIDDDNLFYCFVDFAPQNPTVHVIPAAVVANVVRADHATWLATPGRNGVAHRDTKLRRLKPSSFGAPTNWMDPYLENWAQLMVSP